MTKHNFPLFSPLFKLQNLPGSWKWRKASATRTARSSGSALECVGKAKIQQDPLQSQMGHLIQAHSDSQLPKKSFALISSRKIKAVGRNCARSPINLKRMLCNRKCFARISEFPEEKILFQSAFRQNRSANHAWTPSLNSTQQSSSLTL